MLHPEAGREMKFLEMKKLSCMLVIYYDDDRKLDKAKHFDENDGVMMLYILYTRHEAFTYC